ncbi:MAG: tetraacyldisaccharide 4'-kinase [Pirellulales bacterium]
MLSPSEFRDLVSGRRRGPAAAFWRGLFRAVECPYTLAMRLRNWRYDTGRAPVTRVDVPVVSVGNLSLGGTGKTPMVEWLARWFLARGVRVAVISRGYGAKQGGANDEALELERKLPGIVHLENPDRVAAARRAIDELGCQAILLDDAFQHRRLARDLDIVLLDALEPFGFGHVFPRGTLREPVAGLARAQVVALSRADMAEPAERARIRAEVRRLAPRAAWLELVHAPRCLRSADGGHEPLESLAGQPVAAFCGLGNPAGFRHTLATQGYRVAAFREFADHHAYAPADLASLAAWADRLDVSAVVCTWKDLVKIGVTHLGRRPLWAVAIELEMPAGQPELEAKLGKLIAG